MFKTEKNLERLATTFVVFAILNDAAVTVGGLYAFFMLVGKLF